MHACEGLRLHIPVCEGALSGPLLGVPGEDRYYSTRLRQLLHLDLEEAAASALWSEVAIHRGDLTRRLGRDAGQRVALLDYVINVSRRLVEPQIIERDALSAIEHRATSDPLTGLFNRAYFDAVLHRETDRCQRSGVLSSLALMDLDRFKVVNDDHGHEKGDAVLRTIGAIVREHLRTVDIPCRFGGDELAAVLTDMDEGEAMRVAERVRAAVAAAFRNDAVPVTISIGVAMLVPVAAEGDVPFVRADRALYAAKRRGGNRVISSSSLGASPS